MNNTLLSEKALDFYNKIYPDINNFQNSPKISLTGTLNFGQIIQQLIPYIYTAAGLILLVLIVVSGYNLMTAGSDPKKAQMAKARLTTAFVGFAVVFLSYWMIQIIAQVFDISEISNLFK